MDNEIRRFLSQPVLFKCPKCGSARAVTINDIGKKTICKKCGHILELDSELLIDLDADDELYQDIKEYLKELKSANSQ